MMSFAGVVVVVLVLCPFNSSDMIASFNPEGTCCCGVFPDDEEKMVPFPLANTADGHCKLTIDDLVIVVIVVVVVGCCNEAEEEDDNELMLEVGNGGGGMVGGGTNVIVAGFDDNTCFPGPNDVAVAADDDDEVVLMTPAVEVIGNGSHIC